MGEEARRKPSEQQAMRAAAKQCADCELRTVAKTTTTVNLAAALSEQGEKVLCIDLDPQANLTMSLGCQTPDELPCTMADVIDQAIAEKPIDPMQGVIHHLEGIDLMPSSIQLSGYENVLINEYGAKPSAPDGRRSEAKAQ